jgi:hypothetical protein
MPDYSPIQTYPFAVNSMVLVAQIWIMTTGDLFTYNGRLVAGFGAVAIILAVFPYLVKLSLGVNYWVCFGTLVVYGAFSGVAQGTVFTMAANFPFKYMGAVMFGNGISGFACNILRAVTLAAFPAKGPNSANNSFYSAIVFLSIGSLTLVICVLL